MSLIDQLFRKTDPTWFEHASGREGSFDAVALSDGQQIRVLGTTVAHEGVAFVSTVEVRAAEIPLTFTIRRRTIPSRVRILKGELVQAPKRVVHRYYCSFTSIAADDWDAVVRYVDNIPEPAPVRPAPVIADNDDRSLSARVQRSVVEQLVRLKRLAPPAPGVAPLIRLHPAPPKDLEDGRTARDLRIHSRIAIAGAIRSFDTRFRVFSDDRVELLP
ncbi:MAG: hypothetical protein NVS3B7_14470 [Candidatus Elarobacter sp.]